MERTKLGPVEQFRDDSGAWHVGRRVLNSRGWTVRSRDCYEIVIFRLHDTGAIVLVDASRLEPNQPTIEADFSTGHDIGVKSTFAVDDSGKVELVDYNAEPNPHLPAESQSWHDMMDEVARMPEYGQ